MSLTSPGIDPEQARRLLQEELARPEYTVDDEPLVLRLLQEAFDRLGGLLERTAGAVFGGPGGLLLLAAVVLAVVVAVRLRVGPLARLRPARAPGALGGDLDSAGHRAAADEAAAAGRWADAVRERLRAVVRTLEEAGVLDRRPGRTADEVATDAGAAAPPLQPGLARAARRFDEVWYGGRKAGPGDDALLREVDAEVRAAVTGSGARGR